VVATSLWKASEEPETIDPYTSSELRKILAAAREVDRDYATLIQVIVQASCRPGEGLAIRRCDVDLAAATISVRPANAGAATRAVLDGLRNLRVVPADPKAGGWKSATILLETYAKWIEQAEEAPLQATPASTGQAAGSTQPGYLPLKSARLRSAAARSPALRSSDNSGPEACAVSQSSQVRISP
jgi:hypothetical protein